VAADADTIFALASGVGRAAIAVLRLSGPGSASVLARLCGTCPPARRASLRTLRDAGGEVLDHAMVLWLPGPNSYTGEDSAELHVHGGAAVVDAIAGALVAAGARPAEAGEFTRRAFLHGRVDLLQAEAVADLIDAETSAQRRQALRQMEGEGGALYAAWTARLTGLLAQQEALIDFPDEDLPPATEADMLARMGALRQEIETHVAAGRQAERLREGLVFAVAGAPNVGKSTLINALAGRDVAIVSAHPGTTRDVLETRVVLAGVPVTLLDTAGLRDTDDPVEAEGVRRARARAASADLVIAVSDGAHAMPEVPDGATVLRVASKRDLRGEAEADIAVSALTGAGMTALRERLEAAARTLAIGEGPPVLTRARHRAGLTAAARALAAAETAVLPELRGEELRTALLELGRMTGRVGVEDVLDAVFGQFCIGK
jgi:tRNA modification GTPase